MKSLTVRYTTVAMGILVSTSGCSHSTARPLVRAPLVEQQPTFNRIQPLENRLMYTRSMLGLPPQMVTEAQTLAQNSRIDVTPHNLESGQPQHTELRFSGWRVDVQDSIAFSPLSLQSAQLADPRNQTFVYSRTLPNWQNYVNAYQVNGLQVNELHDRGVVFVLAEPDRITMIYDNGGPGQNGGSTPRVSTCQFTFPPNLRFHSENTGLMVIEHVPNPENRILFALMPFDNQRGFVMAKAFPENGMCLGGTYGIDNRQTPSTTQTPGTTLNPTTRTF